MLPVFQNPQYKINSFVTASKLLLYCNYLKCGSHQCVSIWLDFYQFLPNLDETNWQQEYLLSHPNSVNETADYADKSSISIQVYS